MYESAERTVKRYSVNKAKTDFYSELFIVSTDATETMSNNLRKFNELHKVVNFSWESFRWLRQIQCNHCKRWYHIIHVTTLLISANAAA